MVLARPTGRCVDCGAELTPLPGDVPAAPRCGHLLVAAVGERLVQLPVVGNDLIAAAQLPLIRSDGNGIDRVSTDLLIGHQA